MGCLEISTRLPTSKRDIIDEAPTITDEKRM
jgi:hypothetical protein